jgi:predicted extracellular nuclease
MDVHILGVVELENDGYGPESAIAHLAERLNAAVSTASPSVTTAPAPWSFVDVDAATGTHNALGTDAIRVGFLYRADRVRPVAASAVLATPAFLTGGDSEPRNRPSLAQAFETAAGARVVVNINHLKSKGSPCDAPDAGDGQANCSDVRTAAARELADWLATDPTRTGDPDVLILGDLNAYAKEDPVRALARAGYTDLIAARVGADAYTYVFAGQWGRLDHALASASLAPQVADAAVWHINADEPPVLGYDIAFKSREQQTTLYHPGPYRSSDHDPVVVGLDLERSSSGRRP